MSTRGTIRPVISAQRRHDWKANGRVLSGYPSVRNAIWPGRQYTNVARWPQADANQCVQ